MEDLDSRLRGCRIRGITTYFSNLFEKQGGLQTNATLGLILRFNLRLGGYSIWSAIFQSHTISEIKFEA
jgi:hypothetical protein